MDMSWYSRRRADTTERVQTYNRGKHLLLDPQKTVIGKWLSQHQYGTFKDLFFFFHLHTGNYVVARWLDAKGGRFKEVFIVGHSPWDFFEGDLLNLARAAEPATPEKVERYEQWLYDQEKAEQQIDERKSEATRSRCHVKKPQIIVPGLPGLLH